MCSSGMRSRIWSQRDKEREVESGLIISSAVFVQRRLRVGGEMTFCSIKLQLFYFCSVATLYLLLLSHLCVCVPVCVLPGVRCREGTSPSIPELSAARSAMDFRLLRGSWG